MKNSNNIDLIQEPVIPLIAGLASQSPGTISLGQGVVFYPPPDSVFDFLKTTDLSVPSINLYSYVGGIPTLLKKLEQKLLSENEILISEGVNRIMVSSGANMAFYNIMMSILDAGDEVIMLSPYYFNYEMAVRMFGCRPVIVDSLKPEEQILSDIADKITLKTRAVVTISPNNPTGAIYSENFLRGVNSLCSKKEIYHISDEAYEYFVFNGVRHFSPGSIEGSIHHTISLFSMSKSFGMAGWRIGYSVIPENLISGFRKIQDTNAICPNVVAQYAAIQALESGRQYCEDYLKEIDANRTYALKSFISIGSKLTFKEPEGAIYFYLKINCNLTSLEFAKLLISKYKVAVIPGNAFGSDNGCFIRVGFGALRNEHFCEAVNRLTRGIIEC